MTIILKYHWLQVYNFWRQLGLRVQLELIFLFIVFYSFFTDKLTGLFLQWLAGQNATAFGLANLLGHAIIIPVLFAAPFIYHNLIPRQRGLLILGEEPLSSLQAFMVLLLLFLKYQLLVLLLSIPVMTAVFITAGFWPFLYMLAVLILSSVFSLLLISRLAERAWSYSSQMVVYLILTGGYLTCFYLLYQFTDVVLYFDLFVFGFGGWTLLKSWQLSWHTWDQLLTRARVYLERSTRQAAGLSYLSLTPFIPPGWRPLLIKEVLSYLRNRKYQRLILISLAIFMIALIAIHVYFPDEYLPAVSLLTFLVMWEHYAHQFSEKYVRKDPPLFYKSLPVKFRHLVLSKFISEFIFILSIALMIFIVSLWHGVEISTVFAYCLMVTLISAFILYIIVLMRLIFYDRPRFAGYAYHLMVLLMFILNATYFLVGPIISLFMLLYLNYVSYRQFSK